MTLTECMDLYRKCPTWAAAGDCDTNDWMKLNCRFSCSSCDFTVSNPSRCFNGLYELWVYNDMCNRVMGYMSCGICMLYPWGRALKVSSKISKNHVELTIINCISIGLIPRIPWPLGWHTNEGFPLIQCTIKQITVSKK